MMHETKRTINVYRKRRALVLVMLVAVILTGGGLVWFVQTDSTRTAAESAELGMEAFEIGDYEQAAASLTKAVEHGTADADVITKLALAKLRIGGDRADSQEEVIALLERAIEIDANHLGARRALMMVYLTKGVNVKALEQAQFILARSPRDAYTYKLQTELLTELNDYEGLLDAAQTSEVYSRNDPAIAIEAAIARSVGHLGLGDQDKAYEAALSAMVRDPINTRAVILWLDRLEHTGQTPYGQMEALESMMEKRPDDPRPLKAYALACRELSAQAQRRNDMTAARGWYLKGTDAVVRFIQQDQFNESRILRLADELDHFGRSRHVFQAQTVTIDQDASLQLLKAWVLRGILLEAHGTVIKKWLDLYGKALPDQIDTVLAGMLALCAHLTEHDGLKQVMQTRVAEVNSPVSDFWLAMLSGPTIPREIIESYLHVTPGHPIAEYMLADIEFSKGEEIDAHRRLKRLAVAWPGWNQPAIALSKYYQKIAKPRDELFWAERAKHADHGSLRGTVHLLESMARYPQLLSKDQAEYGLTHLERISGALPQSQRDRLRIQFGLLSANPEGYIEKARSVVKDQTSISTAISLSASAEAAGKFTLAKKLLTIAIDQDGQDHRLTRKLLRLHLLTGEIEQAKKLCQQLLQNPTAEDLFVVASIWKSLQEPTLFEQAIELAPSLVRSEDEAANLMCKLQEASGNLPAAIAGARQSLGLNPDQPEVWQTLLRLELNIAGEHWRATLADAAKVLPSEQLLTSLQSADPQASSPTHRSAVLAALRDPHHASVYIDLIAAKDIPIDRRRVQQLLELHPLAAGLATIRLDQIARGKKIKPHLDEIVSFNEAYAYEAGITRRTTALFMRAGDYKLAKVAADAWRSSALSNPIQIDIVRADIRLRLQDHDGAAQIISPYLSLTKSVNNYSLPLIALLTRIELIRHGPERAWQVVEPYLENGPEWRGMATQFSTQFLTEPVYVSYWLNNIYRSIPQHSKQERFNVANAYASSYQRFNTRLFRDRAIEIWLGLSDDPALRTRSLEAIQNIRE